MEKIPNRKSNKEEKKERKNVESTSISPTRLLLTLNLVCSYVFHSPVSFLSFYPFSVGNSYTQPSF